MTDDRLLSDEEVAARVRGRAFVEALVNDRQARIAREAELRERLAVTHDQGHLQAERLTYLEAREAELVAALEDIQPWLENYHVVAARQVRDLLSRIEPQEA